MLTKTDLTAINNLFDGRFKLISKQLKKVSSKLDLVISYFDTKTLDHEKRISKIEGHLQIPSTTS